MKATWTTQISEAKWRRVRRELEDNGLILPFTQGAASNRNTGYVLTNKYDRDTNRLEIKVAYPIILNRPFEMALEILLVRLFDSPGNLTI